VTKRALTVEAVEGARALIEPAVADYVRQWLNNTTILEAAEVLSVSESTVKAIRAHLGVKRGDDG
jgi:hypothetical protein